MTRSKELDKHKKSQGKSEEHSFEIIIESVIEARTMSHDDWFSLSQLPWAPLAIPVSQGYEYPVTQKGVNAAHELTQSTWKKREDIRQIIVRKEFNKLSFKAIGEAIKNSPNHFPKDVENEGSIQLDESFYDELVRDYFQNLDSLTDQVKQDADQHIPCHLFNADQNVPAFSVGPVDFHPRIDWINKFVTNSVEHDYISQVDAGTLRADELREQANAPGSSKEIQNAWRIISSLRGFPWIATIRMVGHELNQSNHKASIIVGLAIDTIGLLFHIGDARRFTKAGRQHLFSVDRIATLTNGKFLRGMSLEMPGIGGAPGELAKKIATDRPFLDAAGCILNAYVSSRNQGCAPHLIERWVNALYWVGEARREASDFMAVVNYGCAADGLSGAGGDAKEMIEFAEAALNPQREPIPEGALSIEEAVTIVYREGRNKLAHGEMSGLLEDLTKPRIVGDALLVELFGVVTTALAGVIVSRPKILEVDEKHAYRAFKERLLQRRYKSDPEND